MKIISAPKLEMADLELVEIRQSNFETFKNLAQAYEAEFSNITHKMPDQFGIFKIDTLPASPYIGYLLYFQELPVGFCVANIEGATKDIAEFYIVPAVRKKKLGYQLAFMIFNKYPGQWQVRQIEGAVQAVNFWRKVIGELTQNQYDESIVQDDHWGVVTRQRFYVNSTKS